MKTQIIILAALVVTPAFTQAAEICRPVYGVIQLRPDALCQITKIYKGNAYLENGFCFKTVAVGLGSGYSGLTKEAAFGVDNVQNITPSILNEKEAPPMPSPIVQTRQMFTGRTVLTTRDGNIYSADAGTMSVKGSTEQAIIVGGTGRYHGASGYIYAFGDYIGTGKWGTYTGQVCVPR
ncbi:hypothetical protein [Chitinimonas sp. BJB300]|uniref:hypothetical protein n=1 Tax=Chitinimonas sp. BJB300 TaxID=1559339 RepID=UPI000C11FDDB|nr:hypothetical protein [Chitinimonas sp. BJB300]PHV10044.1 hypothetical protein CSQ89_18330 [Chitinimonas sp. BJB300]TSJ91028.1 hypothetical protein FG002_001590 [Chitinimonas sp. BJB300]